MRIEIKHAMALLCSGKNVTIPPKWKHDENQCKGFKAKNGELNIKISKNLNVRVLLSMGNSALKELCSQHHLAVHGSRVDILKRIRQHF